MPMLYRQAKAGVEKESSYCKSSKAGMCCEDPRLFFSSVGVNGKQNDISGWVRVQYILDNLYVS